MNCPGSVALSEGLPDETSSYAMEGTAAHELVEMCLDRGKKEEARAEFYIGTEIQVEDEDGMFHVFIVDQDMADAAQVMIDHVNDRYNELQEEHGTVELHLERTFDLSPLGPPEPMYGTADVTLVVPAIKHLEVIDYKHGVGVVVEVEENSQVMMYSLGATVSQGSIPSTIRTTIVQPRADHPDGPVRSYDFDRTKLIQFKDLLFERARATQEENAPLAVGDWCKFCLAKAQCPAQRDHAHDVAMVEFSIEPEHSLAEVLADPSLLTNDDLAEVLARAGIVMDWLRSVESHALTMAEQGATIPGFKLVEKSTHRRWSDADAGLRFLARQGLKMDERTTRKIISPAQAEKKLKGNKRGLKTLQKYIVKPEGAPKLVPVADKRPEIPTSLEADFGAGLLPHPGAADTQDEQE
jgi:hypothetical protein